MDKTSKTILKYMKSNPDACIMYSDEPFHLFKISEEEFYRCVRYLASNGMVDYISSSNGVHLGIQLTHQAVHQKEIKRSNRINSFITWFFHSYVGGVITGVTGTLLAGFLTSEGHQLFEELLSLIKFH